MMLREIQQHDLAGVETLRTIRNACRATMTRDPREISREQQAKWWAEMHRHDPAHTRWRPFLAVERDQAIGFGVVWRGEHVTPRLPSNEAKEAWWLTGGLLAEHRGNGYGRALFLALIGQVEAPCWLEVRLDNTPARLLYEALGFRVVHVDDDIATMRLGKAPRDALWRKTL
ncbi:MAG TPA: GNAT family N-acetyltransferase [Acidimicrobiales bacterium]